MAQRARSAARRPATVPGGSTGRLSPPGYPGGVGVTRGGGVAEGPRRSCIAGDLATALDPVRLADRYGLDADPWQCDVLRSGAQRMLLNASRQSGKSTTVALLNVH